MQQSLLTWFQNNRPESYKKHMEEIQNQEAETLDVSAPPKLPTTLPMSYVLWLTIRSRFIDELGKTDQTILDKWKEYENLQLEIMEGELSCQYQQQS